MKEFIKNRSGKISGAALRLAAALFSLAALSATTAVFSSVGEQIGFLSVYLAAPGAASGAVISGAEKETIKMITESKKDESANANPQSGREAAPLSEDGGRIINLLQSESREQYVTPEDIRELIDKALEEQASTAVGGKIIEAQYLSGKPYVGYGDLWIMNSAGTNLDLKTLYSKKPELVIKTDGSPQVLIYHTHTCESYVDLDNGTYPASFTSRSEDRGRNMVRVGDAIVEELERAGIGVIHDTQIHDYSYNGSYQRSRAQVNAYLELYPSIVITLDVHRDALEGSGGAIIKPVSVINGKKAAQIMIIAGREGNGITDFPNWENNLSFAVQIQNKANELYSGLMRPIFHCYRKYNMDATPNSLLIEVGTHGNTLDEAVYSGSLFGRALAEMLKEYVT